MIIGYAIRMVRDDGERTDGEFQTKTGASSTPDLLRAKIYKQFGRAYEWSVDPNGTEIVEIDEDPAGVRTVARIMESRRANISQMGDIYYDHHGNRRPGL